MPDYPIDITGYMLYLDVVAGDTSAPDGERAMAVERLVIHHKSGDEYVVQTAADIYVITQCDGPISHRDLERLSLDDFDLGTEDVDWLNQEWESGNAWVKES